MSSDEENNYDEDQIINLISALQQKIKTNRTIQQIDNKQQKTLQLNEFSLQKEQQQQSKHSSVSENLSDFIVRTDKPNEQSKQQQYYDQDYIKQKLDELCQQRERDQEMLEQINAGMMFLISQLPKPKQTNSIGTQTLQEQQQQQQLTPNRKKTAQQTVQQMFQDGDRYVFREMKNLCLRK